MELKEVLTERKEQADRIVGNPKTSLEELTKWYNLWSKTYEQVPHTHRHTHTHTQTHTNTHTHTHTHTNTQTHTHRHTQTHTHTHRLFKIPPCWLGNVTTIFCAIIAVQTVVLS